VSEKVTLLSYNHVAGKDYFDIQRTVHRDIFL